MRATQLFPRPQSARRRRSLKGERAAERLLPAVHGSAVAACWPSALPQLRPPHLLADFVGAQHLAGLHLASRHACAASKWTNGEASSPIVTMQSEAAATAVAACCGACSRAPSCCRCRRPPTRPPAARTALNLRLALHERLQLRLQVLALRIPHRLGPAAGPGGSYHFRSRLGVAQAQAVLHPLRSAPLDQEEGGQ